MPSSCLLLLASWLLLLAVGMPPSGGADTQPALPIFDAHPHYNDDATLAYPVPEALKILQAAGATAILATGCPNDSTSVVPFIRPYRTRWTGKRGSSIRTSSR
jgi:hypothetical protein